MVRERELGIRSTLGSSTESNGGASMTESVASGENTAERKARKVREGSVVSDKMDKTVVVSVEDRASSTPCTARSCAAPASSRRTTSRTSSGHR